MESEHYMRLLWVPVLLLGAILMGCSAPNEACSPDPTGQAEDAVVLSASSEDQSWEEELWEYVESHDPDAEAYPVVRPNTTPVREALREAGARILHEFHSFNGVAIGMKVRDLPNLLDIDHNIDVSFGAGGELFACFK